jgi:hypothetical protein
MIINGILAGSFVLDEIRLYDALSIVMITLGTLICISGILLLLKKPSTTTECRLNSSQKDILLENYELSDNISFTPLISNETEYKNELTPINTIN